MTALKRARMDELCELVTDGTHDSPKLQKAGIPFIKGKNISGGTVDFSTCDFITLEDHEEACRRVKPRRGDILFSNIGSVGDTAIVNDDREFSIKNVALFRPNQQKVDRSYFFYLVLSPEFRSNVINVRSGSAQPFISLANLRSFEVSYVEDGCVQRRIAGILSAYDELIENSQRRIKILESMARCLYREWFVHFRFPGHESVHRVKSPLGEIPEGWEWRELNELGFLGRGKSRHRPRNDSSLYGGPYPFFQTGDIKEARIFLRTHTQTYSEAGLAQSKLWQPGTLCITIAANIGETAILAKTGCIPDSIVGFVPDREKSDALYVKMYLDSIKQQMQNVSRGTTQDNLSVEKLLSFRVLTPPPYVVRAFRENVSPMIEMLNMLLQKEDNLRRTRDLLLPRLLSGQIDVEAIGL